MSEYKRLTWWEKVHGEHRIPHADLDREELLLELAELEDKIESGRWVELPCKVGDYVYIIDNVRHWAKITNIHISSELNGKQRIVYEWAQYEFSVDITELWDEDEFDSEEIGETVLLEKVHEERIQKLIREENLRYAQWEEECEAEARLKELKGENL